MDFLCPYGWLNFSYIQRLRFEKYRRNLFILFICEDPNTQFHFTKKICLTDLDIWHDLRFHEYNSWKREPTYLIILFRVFLIWFYIRSLLMYVRRDVKTLSSIIFGIMWTFWILRVTIESIWMVHTKPIWLRVQWRNLSSKNSITIVMGLDSMWIQWRNTSKKKHRIFTNGMYDIGVSYIPLFFRFYYIKSPYGFLVSIWG